MRIGTVCMYTLLYMAKKPYFRPSFLVYCSFTHRQIIKWGKEKPHRLGLAGVVGYRVINILHVKIEVS